MKCFFFKMILKPFVCGAFISAIGFNSVFLANAGSASAGPDLTISAVGYTYTAHNTVYTGKISGMKFARGGVYLIANKTLPAGYGGIAPKLYDSSDRLLASGAWSYTSSGTNGISETATYEGFTNSPTVYGKGGMRYWNGSNYVTLTPGRTPFLNDYTEGTPT